MLNGTGLENEDYGVFKMNMFKGAKKGGNGPKEEFIKNIEEKLQAGKYFFECVIKV